MNGITKARGCRSLATVDPATVKVVPGKNGSYPVSADDRPIQAIEVLGSVADPAAGMCRESANAAGDCTFSRMGDRLTCQP